MRIKNIPEIWLPPLVLSAGAGYVPVLVYTYCSINQSINLRLLAA